MFLVKSDFPLALNSIEQSVDFGGAMMDDSKGIFFVEVCRTLFVPHRSMALLDLGCSSGGIVETALLMSKPDCEVFACGLEGSQYPVERNRCAWKKYAGTNLFCTDIGEKFEIYSQYAIKHGIHKPFRFDVICSYEVLEHIPEKNVEIVLDNVMKHLINDGVVVFSVSSQPGPHHLTIKTNAWWISQFNKAGLYLDDALYNRFNGNFSRGFGEPNSFIVVLRRKEFVGNFAGN